MDVSKYREQYAEQLERAGEEREGYQAFSQKSKQNKVRQRALESAGALRTQDDIGDAFDIIKDKQEDAELRASTLHSIAIEVGKNPDLIDVVIDVLKDGTEPSTVRLAALQVLQQTSFRAAIFNPKRPAYLAALREIIDAEDSTLRERALEILAQERDEYAQRRLLEGLQDPEKALVPPVRALQLLSYDIHAEHFPILREIVNKPPSAGARREALRLLAADPASREMLASVLNDKGESSEARKVSAVALQSVAPKQFEEHARQIVMDEDEDDADLRATSIAALTQSTSQEALKQDTELSERVENLGKHSRSKEVGRSAARFISKQNE
jgi:HEAT repeat protein